ncbi:hypothetical protein OCU04_012441 [Sclerotinia nivalis]|uniref:BTB domain-containing protein n=1 Tax=Sclerotinia nivalis TaxID=352851 RepID=A0A9X0DE55_9HELO|nr:hypothetical protein OCU04_012441 [Sclerotinia nivalis]
MTAPSKKHWPKRPVLDYSRDEFVRITVGTAPNIDTFNVSKIRLAYYSPYFRTSLNFPREDSQVIALPDICPKIFRHIVQYMNTGTIIISASDQAITRHTYPDKRPKEHMDLPTLARIWFLAHYFLIPHAQNIAMSLMYQRINHGPRDPDFAVEEMATAINIASDTDGTVVADENFVLKLLQDYMKWHSFYHQWTAEQKERIPREVLDAVVVALRKFCVQRDLLAGKMSMAPVHHYYVQDKIDDGDATRDLDLPLILCAEYEGHEAKAAESLQGRRSMTDLLSRHYFMLSQANTNI